MTTTRTTAAIALSVLAIASIPVVRLAYLMHRSRQYYESRFTKVSHDHPLGPGDLLIVTRPVNHHPLDGVYPMFYYTFFQAWDRSVGFQHCGKLNFNHCPDRHGPSLDRNIVTYPNVADKTNWGFYQVVKGDPDMVKHILNTAEAIYPGYHYPSEPAAILDNVYNRFTLDVLSRCEAL